MTRYRERVRMRVRRNLLPTMAVRIAITHYSVRQTSASCVAYYDIATGRSVDEPGQGVLALSNDKCYSWDQVQQAMVEQGLA